MLTAMATPFDEDGRGRRGRRPAAGRATCSSTARTGSSSPARPASAPTLDDEEHIALLRAVVDEVGDEAL